MNVSAKVDVVMANAIPALIATLVADGTPEQADVRADPRRRIVILAPTKQLGTDEAQALGIDPVAIVTPRSPHGARGLIADQIVAADGLTPEERDALMVEVIPCLATSQAE